MISSSNQSNSNQELDTLISKYIKIESALKKITNQDALGHKKRIDILKKCNTDIFKILYSEYEKNHRMLPIHGYPLNKKNESDFKNNFCTLDSETNDIALNAVIARYQHLFKPYQGSSSLVPVKQNSVDPVSLIIKENPRELKKPSSSPPGIDWFALFPDPLSQLSSSLSQVAKLLNSFLNKQASSSQASQSHPINLETPKRPEHLEPEYDLIRNIIPPSIDFFSQFLGLADSFFVLKKEEPSLLIDDSIIQEKMRQSVMASLARRHTPPLQTKPSSREEAISGAITASERASEASMRARSLASSAPAERPPRPQSAISSRANSVVGAPATSSLTGLTSNINITQSVSDLKRKRGGDPAPAGKPNQPLSATGPQIAYFKVGANSPAAQHQQKRREMLEQDVDPLSAPPQKKPRGSRQ